MGMPIRLRGGGGRNQGAPRTYPWSEFFEESKIIMKTALYINASNDILRPWLNGLKGPAIAPIHLLAAAFTKRDMQLGDRAEIETDFNKLQIIPYVVLLNADGSAYCYRRGDGGDESRLHGNYSIGLGGHVDTLPGLSTPLLQHFRSEAAREVAEEVGVDVDLESIQFSHVLYDPTSDVGRVHLGLLCTVQLFLPLDELDPEKNVINDAAFVSLPNLPLDTERFQRLETWSKLAWTLYK